MSYKRKYSMWDGFVIRDNLLFEKVKDSAYDYTTLQILGGKLIPVKVDSPNVFWEGTNSTLVSLSTSLQQLVSATIDEDILSREGSISFLARLDNNDGKDRKVTVDFQVNGVSIYSEEFELDKDEKGRIIVASTYNSVDRSSGDTFSVSMKADKDAKVDVRGDVAVTKLRIEKRVPDAGIKIYTGSIAGSTPTLSELQALNTTKDSFILNTGTQAFFVKKVGADFFFIELAKAV